MADASDLKTQQAASGGIRVNMSAEEAKSEARMDLPAGKFHLKITDMEIKFTSQAAKNAGKPFINFEFTIQDGQYSGRKDWTNAMCFSPALYTISQICKALGMNINPTGGEFVIPDAREFYVGKDLWGIRRLNKKNKNADGEVEPRIELSGFLKYDGGSSEVTGTAGAKVTAGTGGGGKSSVLP
jgi:hypothetical protein